MTKWTLPDGKPKVKFKKLKWIPGYIGVDHEYADGAGGRYHSWADQAWAGPGYQKGHEPNYSNNPKQAAQDDHEKQLRKFIK